MQPPPASPEAEIERGLAEWEARPASRAGRHPELADDFWVERTPEPLDLDRMVGHLRDYVARDPKRLLPVMVPGDEQPALNEALQDLALNPDAVRDLGLGYLVREAKLTGEDRLFVETETEPHGRLAVEVGVALYEGEIDLNNVLALDFLGRNLRRDESDGSVRYFFKPEGRYLAANDEYMPNGVDDLERLFRMTSEYFQVVQENLHEYAQDARQRVYQPDGTPGVRDALVERIRHELADDPAAADLVFAPFSAAGLQARMRQGDWDLARLAVQESAFFTDFLPDADAKTRFHAFDEATALYDEDWMRDFMRAEEPVPGRRFQTAYSELLGTRVVYDPDVGPTPDELVGAMHLNTLCHLAEEAARHDPIRARAVFEVFAKELHPAHLPALYDMVCRFGPELTNEVLNKANLGLAVDEDFLGGYEILRRTGWELEELPAPEIGQHLFTAHLAVETGLMKYLGEPDPELNQLRGEPLSVPGNERRRVQEARWRELYERAETIIERIRAWSGESRGAPTLRVDVEQFRNRWELVDYDLPGRSDKDVITALMDRRETVYWTLNRYARLVDPDGTQTPDEARAARSEFLDRLVGAIEQGYDPRMIVTMPDADEHLRRLMGGHVDSHHKDTTARMLAETMGNTGRYVNVDEQYLLVMYAQHALSEFGEFPAGLLAAWRSRRDPEWSELLGESTRYQDLQFELALTHEWNEPFHQQVRSALRQVDRRDIDRLYRIARKHNELDAMAVATAWATADTGLSRSALRGILGSIRNRDELVNCVEWLEAYRVDNDPLTGSLGSPRSFRALQSRMSAHPDDIRLVDETFSEGSIWRKVIEAPGFDFGSLYDFMKHPEFERLMKRKLDREQPFDFRHKYYLERPLHESVSEALGSLRQGIPGRALQPKKLYHALKQFLREQGSALAVADLAQQEIPEELESGVIGILREQEPVPGRLVDYAVAQIHMKSDPRGWVSGNYTDCCIPFGRSLNNDYMLSPATQYFTVIKRDRIIAQTVVVDTIDRKTGRRAVLLDSIEIANNHRDQREEIERIYRDFWDRFYPHRTLLVGGLLEDPRLGSSESVDAARYQPTAPLDYTDAHRFEMFKVRPPIAKHLPLAAAA